MPKRKNNSGPLARWQSPIEHCKHGPSAEGDGSSGGCFRLLPEVQWLRHSKFGVGGADSQVSKLLPGRPQVKGLSLHGSRPVTGCAQVGFAWSLAIRIRACGFTEGRRDFARIFFADERKIYVMGRGMPHMRPVEPTLAPSKANIGDLSEQVVQIAEDRFTECLSKQLAQVFGRPPDSTLVATLRARATAAMTVNVGLDFAVHMGLMPTFLQPFFLIILIQQAEPGSHSDLRVRCRAARGCHR
ncbi:unnamed protein product [Prorocentrum cordatum]|uniref:Protein transport protein SEC23 n=1 Tax=Prorocentrum cordatum TaxID=2364126 RepID=A0ABN9UDL1_9DINO|nr:unnamed protein product [Polarella glacialis]